ncbi:hypothetical protein FKW77_000236 [Venturia effusa]|uniref:Uncharacterized protein n=1 Tax=Venturia effusa TaxID=50376 RepID=A0A517LJI3_9PEZI|nr:hypothetical protein FKW77_000236 [Venturia effusa]
MPKAPPQKPSSTRAKRTTTTADAAKPSPAKSSKGRGKDSHLYTDDNPATTLQGTGFKDAAAATKTLSLVSKRSLTYQFQTINTMYHRASHHPHKTEDMEEAIKVFKEWIDVTYPAMKGELRGDGGFKPLLSKDVLRKYRSRIEEEVEEADRRFMEVYLGLGKNKRLGNVLLDDKEPGGKDWEVERYGALDALVGKGKETKDGWEYGELWTKEKEPTGEHLKLIAWAWSPVPGRTLAGK